MHGVGGRQTKGYGVCEVELKVERIRLERCNIGAVALLRDRSGGQRVAR